eukprot:569535_1
MNAKSWNCKECTFPNKSGSNCLICSTNKPADEWDCNNCTFNNKPENESCEICGYNNNNRKYTNIKQISKRYPGTIIHWSIFNNINYNLKEQNDNNNWKCNACTFMNESGSHCLVCNTPQLSENALNNGWNCTDCTFINKLSNNSCKICGKNKQKNKTKTKK